MIKVEKSERTKEHFGKGKCLLDIYLDLDDQIATLNLSRQNFKKSEQKGLVKTAHKAANQQYSAYKSPWQKTSKRKDRNITKDQYEPARPAILVSALYPLGGG